MENPVRAITFSRAMEIGCKEDDMWSIVNDDEQLMGIIAEHLKTLHEGTKTNDATMSTGNQYSLSTQNLKDARDDGALLESSHKQNNPTDSHDKESTDDPVYHKFVESFSEAKGMYLQLHVLL